LEQDCDSNPLDYNSTPHDADQDGSCNALDADDDDDGFSDSLEQECGSSPLDALSTPSDLDQDGICDAKDEVDDRITNDTGTNDTTLGDREVCQDNGQERLCVDLWFGERIGTKEEGNDSTSRIIGDGEEWPTFNITMTGLTLGQEYTFEWKVEDRRVMLAENMYCNPGGVRPHCDATTTFIAEGQTWYGMQSHVLSALGPSPNACMVVTLLSAGMETITTENCWVQNSTSDLDGDGVTDPVDQCSTTPAETVVDSVGCQLPDPVVCPTDVCWDGSSRDPVDCSCPPETGSNTSTDQDNLGNEVAEPAFVPGFSMVTATIGLVLGAIVIATRRSEDSQTSHPSRSDNGP